ncbi:MAG TPA: lysylphosphatidylglycerol synthase transmembrane domain-containing protein, partial [Nitrospirota bacterium]|nr:lysylphosphatidylglycerol synthase transmembrane domain-containing protein [Nitrospirota bacterium]
MRDKTNVGAKTSTIPSTGIPEWMDQLFQKLFFLIPIGIIVNIFFYLATTDRQALASVLHFSPLYFALAMLLSIVPWFTGSLRLLIWSRFLGNRITFPSVFKIAIGAELGAAVSPTLIGGSAVKLGMLMRHGFTGGAALSLSALENMEDIIFFLVMVPLSLTITSSWDLPQIMIVLEKLRNPTLWALLGGIVFCLCVILWLVKRKAGESRQWLPGLAVLKAKVRSVYNNFIGTYSLIAREGKFVFAMTMTLTSFQWICRYSIISLLLASMGIPVRPILFMVLQVFVFALMTLVPTPGATGGAEMMFSLMYR